MKTIKSSSEISRIFERGRRIGVSDFSLIVLRNENQHDRDGRVAFIAGKKLGNAVWRNRAKRRMRSVYRDMNVSLDGCDVLFVARSSIAASTYKEILERSEKALGKLQ